jgi:hypothetical protein
MTTGTNVAGLLGKQGAALAGGIVSQQNAMNIPGLFGMAQGYGGFGNIFGGGGGGSTASMYGTVPGSQQTQMLELQDFGF